MVARCHKSVASSSCATLFQEPRSASVRVLSVEVWMFWHHRWPIVGLKGRALVLGESCLCGSPDRSLTRGSALPVSNHDLAFRTNGCERRRLCDALKFRTLLLCICKSITVFLVLLK